MMLSFQQRGADVNPSVAMRYSVKSFQASSLKQVVQVRASVFGENNLLLPMINYRLGPV
jgi:3-deoxy-D-manno-octulosonic-acid transferase